jgi:hypothetical protein
LQQTGFAPAVLPEVFTLPQWVFAFWRQFCERLLEGIRQVSVQLQLAAIELAKAKENEWLEEHDGHGQYDSGAQYAVDDTPGKTRHTSVAFFFLFFFTV